MSAADLEKEYQKIKKLAAQDLAAFSISRPAPTWIKSY